VKSGISLLDTHLIVEFREGKLCRRAWLYGATCLKF
jgi:hypothetical protein